MRANPPQIKDEKPKRPIAPGHKTVFGHSHEPGITDVKSARDQIPITGSTLLGTGNTVSDKTCPHRHVRLKMTMQERLNYLPPKGINVMFYGPRNDEFKLPPNEVNATFYCPVLNPNREEQKYIDDIDEELAKLKVLQDNLHEWHEPQLVKEPKVLMHVLIEKMKDHPELDKHIENMRDVTKTDVTESAINEINKNVAEHKLARYEKLKKSYLKETERKTRDGDKVYQGTIGVL